MTDEPLTVWAVVYSNYEPAEVVALYDNEAAAERHADALDDASDGCGWSVVRWRVASTYEPPAPTTEGAAA